MYSGTIHIDEDARSSALTTHLAECLRQVHALRVTVGGNRVAFRGGIFRIVTNWNVLCPFGSGELEVDSATRQVRYRLSLAQLMIVVTALTVFMAVLMLSLPLPKEAVPFSMGSMAAFLILLWVWLVGLNVLIGIYRFGSFLRRSISTAPKGSEE